MPKEGNVCWLAKNSVSDAFGSLKGSADQLPAEPGALDSHFQKLQLPQSTKPGQNPPPSGAALAAWQAEPTVDPALATANNNLLTSSWQGQGICLAILIWKKGTQTAL